jgi:hypothetical protein
LDLGLLFALTRIFIFYEILNCFFNDLGMTKEVSNLIKENNELLETK